MVFSKQKKIKSTYPTELNNFKKKKKWETSDFL